MTQRPTKIHSEVVEDLRRRFPTVYRSKLEIEFWNYSVVNALKFLPTAIHREN